MVKNILNLLSTIKLNLIKNIFFNMIKYVYSNALYENSQKIDTLMTKIENSRAGKLHKEIKRFRVEIPIKPLGTFGWKVCRFTLFWLFC